MEIEYLKRMDRIIKKAGTKDPDDVLALWDMSMLTVEILSPDLLQNVKQEFFTA